LGTSFYYSMDMNVNGECQDKTIVAFKNNDTHKKTMLGVWNFFEKIGKDLYGIERVACNFCRKDFAIGKKKS